jgi:hypothetical protein
MRKYAQPTIDFEQAVVFANSAATKYAHVKEEVAALEANFGWHRVRVVETSPLGEEANYELIDRELSDGDIAFAGGGDGTARLFRYAKQLVVPMKIGRACDLHHMLYGRRGQLAADILQHKRLREIGLVPLQAELSPPEEMDELAIVLEALAYVSVGLTGKVAREHLNAADIRDRHEDGFWGDVATLRYTIGNAQDYAVEHSGDGAPRRILDILATRGHTIAKHGRTPNSLLTPETAAAVVAGGQRHLKPAVIGSMLRLATGLLPHQRLPADGLAFTALEPMVGQVDGEPFDIPAGWQLRIGNDLRIPEQPAMPVRLLATASRL